MNTIQIPKTINPACLESHLDLTHPEAVIVAVSDGAEYVELELQGSDVQGDDVSVRVSLIPEKAVLLIQLLQEALERQAEYLKPDQKNG